MKDTEPNLALKELQLLRNHYNNLAAEQGRISHDAGLRHNCYMIASTELDIAIGKIEALGKIGVASNSVKSGIPNGLPVDTHKPPSAEIR